MIQLVGTTINPCKACLTYEGKANYSFNNDMFAEIFEKMIESDGIILESPVYSADVSSNMKALIDRGAVVACRRGGALNAIDTLNHSFLNHEMFVVGSTYWNMVYGQMPGDVKNDEEGMTNMKNLGKNMAYLLKKIKQS